MQIPKPAIVLKMPITEVSLSSSRIEKMPKEESKRAKTGKRKEHGD